MGNDVSAFSAYQTIFGVIPLGALPVFDTAVLKTLYRKRVFDLHPDRAQTLGRDSHELAEELKRVNRAYAVLKPLACPRVLRRDSVSNSDRPVGAKPASTHRWSGALPKRRLPLGEYLYYSRRISWAALVDALAWQKRQRPMLGEIARRQGLLDHFQLTHVLRARARHERFGECAVRLGYVSDGELRSLLAAQFALQERIGQFFVQNGDLSQSELDELIDDHVGFSRRFG